MEAPVGRTGRRLSACVGLALAAGCEPESSMGSERPVSPGASFAFLDAPVDRLLSPSGEPSEYFGVSVEPAGDLDGDGFDDFAVWAANNLAASPSNPSL